MGTPASQYPGHSRHEHLARHCLAEVSVFLAQYSEPTRFPVFLYGKSCDCHNFLGAATGSPYIAFISTSSMLHSSDIYMYIYIICVPTRNRNNEFILEFILRENKMADFERR